MHNILQSYERVAEDDLNSSHHNPYSLFHQQKIKKTKHRKS